MIMFTMFTFFQRGMHAPLRKLRMFTTMFTYFQRGMYAPLRKLRMLRMFYRLSKGNAGTAEKVQNVYNVYILSKGYACIENVCKSTLKLSKVTCHM